MSVAKQQITANTVLDKLKTICPYAIVAGGAPRDWYLGKEAKDIDVYFSTTALTETVLLSQLKEAFGGLEVKFSKRTDIHTSPMYKTLDCLIRIIEITIDNTVVQLIQMDNSRLLFNLVDKFSVSICKIWYKDGKIHTTPDFKLTEKTGIMFLSDGYHWDDPHPAKMKERFGKQFSCGSKQQAKDKAFNLFMAS